MIINFATDSHRTTYERVATMLVEEYGRQARPHASQPLWALEYGSATVVIAVEPFGEDNSLVRVVSAVVTDAEHAPELHRSLLERNFGLTFGSFALDGAGTITLQYSLLGSECTAAQLATAIRELRAAADAMDDLIVSSFGGQRAVDRTHESEA